MTGQPPFGALPFGSVSEPETAFGLPLEPVDRYSSSLARPLSASRPLCRRAQMSFPCGPATCFGGL